MCLGYRGEDGSDSDWSYISGRGLEGRSGQGCVHFFPSPSFLLPFSSLFLLGRAALAGPPALLTSPCLLQSVHLVLPLHSEQEQRSLPLARFQPLAFLDWSRSQSRIPFSKQTTTFSSFSNTRRDRNGQLDLARICSLRRFDVCRL